MILDINNKMPMCSKLTEFIGIKILINDVMYQLIANIMKMYTEQEGNIFDTIEYIQDELYQLKSVDKICKVFTDIYVGNDSNYYILLGIKLRNFYKYGVFTEFEMNITDNPTLSNDVLENMKKLHGLLQVNKPFESYTLVHKIYTSVYYTDFTYFSY
jgi:hypothetical protein